MHLLTDSILYRALRRLGSWLAQLGRESLVGRALTSATRAMGRISASSLVFGTSHFTSTPLGANAASLSVSIVSRPYVGLRRLLADGVAGRALERIGAWTEQSSFRRGEWLRLVGAALIGMGCGRAVLTAIGGFATLLLVVAGLLFAVWGPRLVSAVELGLVFSRLTAAARPVSTGVDPSLPQNKRLSWVVAVGMVLCGASGFSAGVLSKSGPVWLAVTVLAICATVLLLRRPEAILLGVAAFPWLDSVARGSLGGLGAAWDEGLLLTSVALVLWGALVTGRLHLRTVPILLPTLCALTAAVGSIVVRGVPSDAGLFALRVVFEPILFYLLAFLLATSVGWVKLTIGVFLASSTGLAAHGLYQFATRVPTPTRWVDINETEIVTRAFSVIGNPNGLGTVLLIGTLVAFSLLLAPGVRWPSRVGLCAAVMVHAGGIAVTFSRGAWIGLVFGIAGTLMLAYRRYLLPVTLVGAAGLLAAPDVFVRRFLFLFSATYVGNSAIDGRTIRWAAALDQMAAHPWFGTGLGTFGGSAAERFGYWATWVDNYYLQVGAEGGLLLLAALLWLLLRVAKGLVKSHRVAGDPFLRALAAGVFGGLVAVAVANVFVSAFETLAVGVAFWFLAGLATSAALNSERTKAPAA